MFIHSHLTAADIHAALSDHTSVKEDHVRGSAANIQVHNDNAVVLRIFQAPLPCPAITDSRSGPAVDTTKSPANTLSSSRTMEAFSFLADSPVMMAAPVSTCAGTTPAL